MENAQEKIIPPFNLHYLKGHLELITKDLDKASSVAWMASKSDEEHFEERVAKNVFELLSRMVEENSILVKELVIKIEEHMKSQKQ